jgi:hypothetical protein
MISGGNLVKHIVCWDITDKENIEEHAKQLKNALETLHGKISGLIKIEVGLNYSDSETSSDIVLYSEFESKEALSSYIKHPLHVEVGQKIVRPLTCNRRMIDYEV